MKVEEITVSRSKKVNLGNYESAEAFVAVKATIESSDSSKAVADTLFNLAKTLLEEHAPKDLEQRARERMGPAPQGGQDAKRGA